MAPKQVERWSMYPDLDADVSRLLADSGLSLDFHQVDDGKDSTRAWDTNVMGRFSCHNKNCRSTGWSSKKIAITIRMYKYIPSAKYNARVYHQRCKSCNRLSRPVLDSSYAERVAYRLKKWHGIQTETAVYSGGSKGPHNSRLCEGCKDGHCRQMEYGGLVEAMHGLFIY
ncbi:conserved hypothetical protein [Uncinocarpus reesii 1704]|uniref:3CxxC-type domain-containing protein n=1 Tax=Uncinocarpus reesii (strain UAMH 1704) TaxID=336963 RepID=C4JKX2_UNCRE|nr:uncharacterized protein UREG_00205 [Uncinocarpus reesii 1704]EEP75359.1 conserved hypothetical protein [Uncinocarpus reesii 1704]